MKVAVVGATGIVGQEMLKVLQERQFPYSTLYPVGSSRSQGQTIEVNGEKMEVKGIKEVVELKPDLALFSAGKDVALEWAPEFARVGTTVVDNSAAFRMEAGKKLVVPEINGDVLTAEDKIIANPNCSTIQMLMEIGRAHV